MIVIESFDQAFFVNLEYVIYHYDLMYNVIGYHGTEV